MSNEGGEGSTPSPPGNDSANPSSGNLSPPAWLKPVSVGVAAAAVIVFVLSGLSAMWRQPTPFENILSSFVLAVISAVAGWLFSEWSSVTKDMRAQIERNERVQQERKEIERNALSSVRRIFALMKGFSLIEGHALRVMENNGKTAAEKAERATAFALIAEMAQTHRLQAEDSVKDWQYFAPEKIQAELDRVQQQSRPTLEGSDE